MYIHSDRPSNTVVTERTTFYTCLMGITFDRNGNVTKTWTAITAE